MQLLDVVRENTVLAGKLHKIADILMGAFEDRAAFQRAPEFDGLTGAHQLDSQDIFEVVQHLIELPAADAAHADMIFLRRATGRVRDREEREGGTKEERSVLRAGAAAQRVTRLVRVVPDRGHDEVRAVDGDHARLCEPRARVVLLHGRVHAHERHEHAEREVERDEEAVKRAPGRGKERVEHAGERDRGDVHARGGADEDPLPEVRVGLFPVLEAGLSPRVREVDEEDEAEEDEDGSTDHRDVVAPEHEEAVRDEERHDDQNKPEEGFGTPPSAICQYDNM